MNHISPNVAQKLKGFVMIQFPPEMDENWLRYELLN